MTPPSPLLEASPGLPDSVTWPAPAGSPLPESVLRPIAAGIAAGTPLWQPLLADARRVPVLLVTASDYEVWLEDGAAGPATAPAAGSHAVAPVDGGSATIHVYAPSRGRVRGADTTPGAAPDAPPVGPRVPASVASFALHPARGAGR